MSRLADWLFDLADDPVHRLHAWLAFSLAVHGVLFTLTLAKHPGVLGGLSTLVVWFWFASHFVAWRRLRREPC